MIATTLSQQVNTQILEVCIKVTYHNRRTDPIANPETNKTRTRRNVDWSSSTLDKRWQDFIYENTGNTYWKLTDMQQISDAILSEMEGHIAHVKNYHFPYQTGKICPVQRSDKWLPSNKITLAEWFNSFWLFLTPRDSFTSCRYERTSNMHNWWYQGKNI